MMMKQQQQQHQKQQQQQAYHDHYYYKDNNSRNCRLLTMLLLLMIVVITARTSDAFVITTPIMLKNISFGSASGGGGGCAGGSSSSSAEKHYYSGGISSNIGSGIISSLCIPSLQYPPSKQLLENSCAAARGGGRYGRRRSTENLLVLTNRLLLIKDEQEHDYYYYGSDSTIHPETTSSTTTAFIDPRKHSNEYNNDNDNNNDDDDDNNNNNDNDIVVVPVVPKTKPNNIPKFETQLQNVIILPSSSGDNNDNDNTHSARDHDYHEHHYTYSLEDTSDPHNIAIEERRKFEALSNKVNTPSLSKLVVPGTTTTAISTMSKQNVSLSLKEKEETSELLGFESTTNDVLNYLQKNNAFGSFVKDGTAVVTDGTSIMGRELIKGLIQTSLKNVIVCTSSDINDIEQLRLMIQKQYGSVGASKLYFQTMNLNDLTSIRDGSKQIIQKFGPSINILCNNASLNYHGQQQQQGISEKDEIITTTTTTTTTKQGFELYMGYNYISHYFLTKQLLPFLSEEGRIVTVTSTAYRSVKKQHLKKYSKLFSCNNNYNEKQQQQKHSHVHLHSKYIHYGERSLLSQQQQEESNIMTTGTTGTTIQTDPWKSYAQSKLATLLFAKELQNHLSNGTTSIAVHPGIMGLNHKDDEEDTYCSINDSTNDSSSSLLLMESLCDTMTCKTPNQASSSILYGCLLASSNSSGEKKDLHLIQGGDLITDCQSSSRRSKTDESIIKQYQHACWINTQQNIDENTNIST